MPCCGCCFSLAKQKPDSVLRLIWPHHRSLQRPPFPLAHLTTTSLQRSDPSGVGTYNPKEVFLRSELREAA